jgi:hypothetical protein
MLLFSLGVDLRLLELKLMVQTLALIHLYLLLLFMLQPLSLRSTAGCFKHSTAANR